MFHLIYIFAFTILAFLAVGNLIRNLMTLGIESQRHSARGRLAANAPGSPSGARQSYGRPHPELLDEHGNVVSEPYLVMRSMTVEDVRERLDAIYNASPSPGDGAHDEAQ